MNMPGMAKKGTARILGDKDMIDAGDFALNLKNMLNKDMFFIANLCMTEEKDGWKKVSFLYKENVK